MMNFLLRHGPILLLLTVFAAVYAMTVQSFGMFMWDEAEYASIAQSILRGEGFAIGGVANCYRLPVLPMTSAMSMAVLGTGADWVAKLPSIAFALLAIGVVYGVVRTQYDALTGLIAAAFLGVFPSFWLYTAHLLTEIPFMTFFSSAVFFLYFALYRDRRWLCASAACSAIAQWHC